MLEGEEWGRYESIIRQAGESSYQELELKPSIKAVRTFPTMFPLSDLISPLPDPSQVLWDGDQTLTRADILS